MLQFGSFLLLIFLLLRIVPSRLFFSHVGNASHRIEYGAAIARVEREPADERGDQSNWDKCGSSEILRTLFCSFLLLFTRQERITKNCRHACLHDLLSRSRSTLSLLGDLLLSLALLESRPLHPYNSANSMIRPKRLNTIVRTAITISTGYEPGAVTAPFNSLHIVASIVTPKRSRQ